MEKITKKQLDALKRVRKRIADNKCMVEVCGDPYFINGICMLLCYETDRYDIHDLRIYNRQITMCFEIEKLADDYPSMMKEIHKMQLKKNRSFTWGLNKRGDGYRIKFLDKWIARYEEARTARRNR